MVEKLTGYDLSRTWFDFCFENPEKVNCNHTALYFFIIEHCNRLGWKDKFGLPTTMAMEALGIRSYKTYKKTLTDLTEFGFVEMVEISKNQYSSNIVALVNFTKALTKALDKALAKHSIKHIPKQVQSNDSIDKQVTINKEQENNEQGGKPPTHTPNEILFFKNFQDFIKNDASNVGKMKEPFTIVEYLKLKETFTSKQIKDLILNMGNSKPLLSKNISAYRTFLNWMARSYVTEEPKNEITNGISINDRLKAATQNRA